MHGRQNELINNSRPVWIRLLYNNIERIGINISDKIIATDKQTFEYYLTIYPGIKHKMKVIPSGVDTSFFQPFPKPLVIRKKLGLSGDQKYITYIGRLAYPKLVLEIIRVFKRLTEKFDNATLLIIGDGKEKGEIIEAIHNLNLSKKVKLLGSVPKNKVRDYINCSSVGILLSQGEGIPISIKEFLACGVPVVANNTGDIYEYVINDKTGFLVEEIDEIKIADQIFILLKNNELYKNDCVNTALQYSTDIIYHQIYQVVHQVLST